MWYIYSYSIKAPIIRTDTDGIYFNSFNEASNYVDCHRGFSYTIGDSICRNAEREPVTEEQLRIAEEWFNSHYYPPLKHELCRILK